MSTAVINGGSEILHCPEAKRAVADQQLEPAEKYDAFCAVLARDASDSLAAVDLVLAQPSISSQLVDNLNASSHLRALLTDLFLLGEILRTRVHLAISTAKG